MMMPSGQVGCEGYWGYDSPELIVGKVDETAAISATRMPRLHSPLSEYSDGLEQPQKTAKASAEDQIAALRSRLEEQRWWNASIEKRHASLAARVGRLESLEFAGNVVAAADVIVMIPPDAHKATADQPQGVADTNPDATLGGADTAELEQTCELPRSMWNCPLFLGRRDVGMGRVVTLWTLLVLLGSMLLQTTITVIVLLNLGDPTFVASMIQDLWYASEPRFASA
jgi:hypothetical protein